jgi:hypothetical protein
MKEFNTFGTEVQKRVAGHENKGSRRRIILEMAQSVEKSEPSSVIAWMKTVGVDKGGRCPELLITGTSRAYSCSYLFSSIYF